MTTTLRPTGPLQQSADGAKSRTYEVRVNSRPVGGIELATHPVFGPGVAEMRDLSIEEPDRRRGRATVAVLAAEEVVRGWGCNRIEVAVPAAAAAAHRLAVSLGYVERNRNMVKSLTAEPPALPAGVEGREMTEDEYEVWLAHQKEDYARTWMERGVPEAQARAKSDADHRDHLPRGLATPGTSLSVLTHEGTKVGTLWLALRDGDGFVFDVQVDEEHRGHGHGRSLMLLAETQARAVGLNRIGLNVFAGNAPALGLYESLGYEPVTYYVYKQLL
ncbi:GNAT family N-acetyltransferase [Streptomyces sp. NPDC046925]|uniref:GNAT family N-acetyltransferase n=1 Tax=Streptomyces sp. NPDC046925 TaxID=3155375 RepID=UPI0033EA2400